jgi:hypothetical protein
MGKAFTIAPQPVSAAIAFPVEPVDRVAYPRLEDVFTVAVTKL